VVAFCTANPMQEVSNLWEGVVLNYCLLEIVRDSKKCHDGVYFLKEKFPRRVLKIADNTPLHPMGVN